MRLRMVVLPDGSVTGTNRDTNSSLTPHMEVKPRGPFPFWFFQPKVFLPFPS